MLRWVGLAIASILLVACNQAPAIREQPSAQAGKASPTAYTQFEDPVEQAFTIDVPQGWSVKGGVFRLGCFDVRPMVEMKSPDGKIVVRVNDYGVPSYSVPDRAHPKEGVSYTLEAQAQITVAQFRSGPEFALRYGESRFKDTCAKMEVASNTAPLKIKFTLPPPEDTPEESEGEVTYRCADGSQAFVYAKTSLVRTSPPQLWTVAGLLSYYAPADRAGEAAAVATHVADSFHINPKWLDYQKQMDQKGIEFAQALARKKMQALSQQVREFRARMQAMSKQTEAFDDALRGITRTHDPLTGENREVWTGQSGQYWVNGLGQVVNSPASPGSSFHPLQVIR